MQTARLTVRRERGRGDLSGHRVRAADYGGIDVTRSARTTNRFPSPRCASATKIVRPLESKADSQPQLQPALLRLSAMISQYFTHPKALNNSLAPARIDTPRRQRRPRVLAPR